MAKPNNIMTNHQQEIEIRDLLMMARITEKIEEVGDCWEWRGYMGGGASPAISLSDEYYGLTPPLAQVRTLVYVLMYQRKAKGIPTAGCGNVRCVNPNHIKVMTKAGMTRFWAKPTLSRSIKISATKRKTAKLTSIDQARQIRLATGREAEALGAEAGISRSSVYKIKRGELWRDTTSPWAPLMET